MCPTDWKALRSSTHDVTSQVWKIRSGPESASAFSNGVISKMWTLAPREERILAAASPIPEAPPSHFHKISLLLRL